MTAVEQQGHDGDVLGLIAELLATASDPTRGGVSPRNAATAGSSAALTALKAVGDESPTGSMSRTRAACKESAILAAVALATAEREHDKRPRPFALSHLRRYAERHFQREVEADGTELFMQAFELLKRSADLHVLTDRRDKKGYKHQLFDAA